MTDFFFFNNFDFLKPQQKKFLRENDIFMDLLLFLSSMFEYEGFSEDVNTDFIEFYCSLNPLASCGVFRKENGKEVVGYTTEGGMLNEYGVCEKFNLNTLNGTHKEGAIDGVNTAICWNNKAHKSDLVKLSRFTEMLNLVETAEKCLIRYARLFPVYEVQDANVRHQIDNALKNADNGEPFTYSTKSLSKLGVDGQPGVNIINLGDFKAVDKIQYLSTFRNDTLRIFYSMFGMPYSQSMKQAQQSVEEIHSDSICAWIIPNDRLEQRKKFVETYKRVFNRPNAKVRYSDAWLKGYEKFMTEQKPEETEDPYARSLWD